MESYTTYIQTKNKSKNQKEKKESHALRHTLTSLRQVKYVMYVLYSMSNIFIYLHLHDYMIYHSGDNKYIIKRVAEPCPSSHMPP